MAAIVQLAALLRMIATHEDGRQLIITTHERALFEHLCLELGPTRAEDSLIAIELGWDEKRDGPKIEHERRSWERDKLMFGA